MLVKLLGSCIVFIASALMGYALARDCRRRPNELRTLQALLQMFENEITYLSNLLSTAFTNISSRSSSTVSVFFSSTIENLQNDTGINASEAWEIAINENLAKTSLSKEDKDILISFGKMLGKSDTEGQIKNIKLTLNQLKLQEQKAEERRSKNETMYKTLGILGGIAVVIILI